MIKKFLAVAISLAFAGASGFLHAEGNSQAGKEKSASCAGCHGADGNSAMPLFPKLAGQHPTYLVMQLQAFKDGSRKDPTMGPMAAGLSEQDMRDIAAYYATEKVSANKAPEIESDDDEDLDAAALKAKRAKQAEQLQTLLKQGSDLYRNGDLEREVSACIACHGPYGEGNKPAGFPAIRGQHADYLIKTLTDFKTGNRADNPEHMMHMIAKKMTAEEIKAVAYHISIMKE
ncbi:MAG: c-type cytochrome [Gammaproteobacteria bacterium]